MDVAARAWRVSVIIPTLDEEASIADVVKLSRSRASSVDAIAEIIVADGGSRDQTCHRARAAGARIVSTTEPHRARQLNAAAREARGEVLLFLHADTQLPHNYDVHICSALAKDGFRLGAFQLRVDSLDWRLRVVETFANLRSCWLGLPYGDQALFVGREGFFELGAFPELELMEDFVFARVARRSGDVIIADAEVLTSARRWEKFGVFTVTLLNQLIIVMYYCGVSTQRLRSVYRAALQSCRKS